MTPRYPAVFVGGALGSLLRELVVTHAPLEGPLTSTFLVNAVACLLLGWLHAARDRLHEHVVHLAAVGFCGGLSTFSSFVADLVALADGSGRIDAAFAAALEIATGLVAAAIGLRVGRAPRGGARR